MSSKAGEAHLKRAINDVLDILSECQPCRLMFASKDQDYAIDLLKRMRRNKSIIISSKIPTQWKLSSNYKLRVKSSEDFGDAAAAVRDLAGSNPGKMQMPCIYINVAGFFVTAEPAESFALYGLEPPVQRAVAIIHELAHVADVIEIDGGETEELRKKSVANTDCVRGNCISCKEFKSCRVNNKGTRNRDAGSNVQSH